MRAHTLAIRVSGIGISLVIAAAALGQLPEGHAPDADTRPAPQPSLSPTSPTTQTQTSAAPEAGVAEPWSFELFYWLTQAHPDLRGGKAATDFESLSFPGNSRPAPGAVLSFPVSQIDMLRVTYFEMTGKGNTTASQNLDLFSTNIPAGDYLAAQYRLRAAKLSFEDLFYPFPGNDAKLHFKTLWEVQYATINSRIDAPLDTTTDSTTGTTTYPSATGNRQVILPSFGGAIQYRPSARFSMELRGSGFGIPHHSALLDSEASIAYRIGRVRLVAGGKFYHWKTSPQNAEYFNGSITGAFAGLAWVGE